MIADASERSLDPVGAIDERQLHQPRPEDEGGDAAEAEEQHDDERRAEDRVARRERAHRKRQHRDRVDHSERDDRKSDGVEPEPYAAEPPQRPDLDDVVEPERQHDPARRGGPARGEAAAAIGPVAREEPLPAERAQEEAREVRGRRGQDERDVRLFQRPAGRREPSRGEKAGDDDHDGEGDTRADARALPRGAPSRRSSCLRQHVEDDRRVLAGNRDDHERVEQLVVAERRRRGVRALAHVHDRSDGVGESSGEKQQGGGRARCASMICGRTSTAVQPSPTLIAGASQVGGLAQTSLTTAARHAPPQTVARIGTRQSRCRTSSPIGAYVPAISA